MQGTSGGLHYVFEVIFFLGNGGITGAGFADRLLDDIDSASQVGVADNQGTQELDDLVVRSAGLDDQSLLESPSGDIAGQLPADAVEPLEHAAPERGKVTFTVLIGDGLQPLRDIIALALHLLGKPVLGPVVINGCRSGDKGQVVAAEGSVVFARAPLVQFGLEQYDGQGQAIAAQ